MSMIMVLAYHVIFSMYGFWLPNDPRGSWSDFVGAWELLRFGTSTKTDTRRSVAAAQHDRQCRGDAKNVLKYPSVLLDGIQARAVGRGFARYVQKSEITIFACSILPDHVHLVVGRHHFKVENVVNQLKGYATRQLTEESIHPLSQFDSPTCWARGQWKVFLNDPRDIVRAIKYVVNNPGKEGLPDQYWNFNSAV